MKIFKNFELELNSAQVEPSSQLDQQPAIKLARHQQARARARLKRARARARACQQDIGAREARYLLVREAHKYALLLRAASSSAQAGAREARERALHVCACFKQARRA